MTVVLTGRLLVTKCFIFYSSVSVLFLLCLTSVQLINNNKNVFVL